ncbi:hypothetical protein ACFQAT_28080 [Undibacterium arcticum]|uniref:hypothetical protein n=1 Tax=Undibacterium arcticum TaxID=1762892 RepID=UPI00361113A7
MTIREGVHARCDVGAVSSSGGAGNLEGQSDEPLSPRTIKITTLCGSDSAVAKVMRLLVAEDSDAWVGLYRMLEVVKKDVGNEQALIATCWTNKPEYNRFTRTANSVSAVGDAARHGSEKDPPPENPMTLAEAKDYLYRIVQLWLQHKGV